MAGKVTGGGSAVNATYFHRGAPGDYDQWAAAGNDAWSYEKLLPYFKKLETDLDFGGPYHGKDGPILVRRAKKDAWGPIGGGLLRGLPPGRLPRRPRHESPRRDGSGAETSQLRRWAPHQHGGRLSEPEPGTRQPDYTSERAGPPDFSSTGGRAVGVEIDDGGQRRNVRGGEVIVVRGGYRVAVPAGAVGGWACRAGPGDRRASGAGLARTRGPTCGTIRLWRRSSASERRPGSKGRRRSLSSATCRRARTTATASRSRPWWRKTWTGRPACRSTSSCGRCGRRERSR